MEKTNSNKTFMTGRHPIYQAAEKLRQSFINRGFQVVENGEGNEIEPYDVTFPVWEEPDELFGWQKKPICMNHGRTILRTRLLPRYLKTLLKCPPFRILAFGRVYQDRKDIPITHQMEGMVIDSDMSFDAWQKIWQEIATEFYGADTEIVLESICEDAYRISVKNLIKDQTVTFGYTGLANEKALNLCGASGENLAWVFILDVDELTLQLFSLPDYAQLYENDVTFLNKFENDAPTRGETTASKAIDALRSMGYLEVCGDVLYPEDAYKKMTMIQESWDKNNQSYALSEPLGDLTGTRTVLTPALEKIMGLNFEHGNSSVQIFEVGHIYMPQKDQVLPKEHLAAAMAAFGPDVTIESFQKDVKAFLQAMGIGYSKFISTSMATAYKWNECMVIVGKTGYLDSNFGRISEQAGENYGIGVPAYFAQFELNTLAAAATK